LVICVIRLALADIPWDTGTTKHHASKAKVECFSSGHDSDVLGTPNPDAVVCEKFFGFVNTIAELGRPLIDVVQKTYGDILRYTAGPDICGMETGAGNTLIEFL
jgi:hypothetical protein